MTDIDKLIKIAEQGNTEAMACLAAAYRFGWIVNADQFKAQDWFARWVKTLTERNSTGEVAKLFQKDDEEDDTDVDFDKLKELGAKIIQTIFGDKKSE